MQQHVVGHRDVIFHFAFDGEAEGRASCRADCAAGRPGLRGSGAARGDVADRDACVGGEVIRAGRGAVRCENKRNEAQRILVAQRSGTVGGHRLADDLEKIAGGALSPGVQESAARERRGFHSASHVGEMAGGALLLIQNASPVDLREAEGARGRSLPRGDEASAACGDRSDCQKR
jgi:hypothetical protein